MADITITVTEIVDAVSVESAPTTITVTDGVFVDSGSGGGGSAVASVNGETGTVVLSAADVGAQPVDSDLTAIAALSTTTFGRALLALADAAALRTAAGLGTAAVAATSDFDAAGAASAAQAASQPLDADLTSIAALTTTTFGRSLLTQADAAATRSTIGAGTSSFDGAYSSLTGKPTLGTAAAAATTDFDAAGAAASAQAASQPVDSDLTAIAALTTTTFGRSLLTQADAAAARATIGAGTSSLAIGTTSTTAKAGDYQPASTNISDASTIGKTILTAADAAAVRSGIGLGTAATTSATAGGDLSGTLPSPTVVKLNGTSLAGLGTGLLKNTTGTGVPSIAVAADIPNIAESQVTNLTTDLAAKAPLASPTFTGTVTIPTATAADSSTKAASTAYVQGELTAKAPLASPTFTGTPAAPTATAGTNTTQLATTAYVTNAVAKQPEVFMVAVSDESTALTTGTAKVTFRMPFPMTLTSVRASLTTASTSGLPTIDIKESGTTIFSTTLTIDANEKTSTTAATAAVLSDTSLADDAEMTIDITTAGTGAKGLKVYFIGTRT